MASTARTCTIRSLVFDGDTGEVITAVLRPGTCHASRGALAVLKRFIRRLRARWPGVPIEVRADSGFAVPAVYEYLEGQGIRYTIALGRNPRLEAKDLKDECFADRLSWHRFCAHQFRLLRYSAA